MQRASQIKFTNVYDKMKSINHTLRQAQGRMQKLKSEVRKEKLTQRKAGEDTELHRGKASAKQTHTSPSHFTFYPPKL